MQIATGAKRYEQLGVDVCLKTLDSTLDGLLSNTDSGARAVLVLDPNPVSGDMLEARMA